MVNENNNTSIDVLNDELVWAAFKSDHVKVRQLLEQGADVNFVDAKSKHSAFFFAAQADSLESVKAFVDHGVNIDIKNKYGLTTLYWLCDKNVDHYEIIDFLLKNGANPNVQDAEMGYSPLNSVISKYRLSQNKMIQSLLTHGANPFLKDRDGEDAFDMARRIERPDIIDMMRFFYDQRLLDGLIVDNDVCHRSLGF